MDSRGRGNDRVGARERQYKAVLVGQDPCDPAIIGRSADRPALQDFPQPHPERSPQPHPERSRRAASFCCHPVVVGLSTFHETTDSAKLD